MIEISDMDISSSGPLKCVTILTVLNCHWNVAVYWINSKWSKIIWKSVWYENSVTSQNN